MRTGFFVIREVEESAVLEIVAELPTLELALEWAEARAAQDRAQGTLWMPTAYKVIESPVCGEVQV